MRSNRVSWQVRSFVRALTRWRRDATGTWTPGVVHGRDGDQSYLVYVPAGLGHRFPVPLVVLLHGCRQTAAEFAAATRFAELADRHGFVVLCPEQSARRHRQRCWRWYEAAHQHRGAGEPAIIAEITAAVVAEAARWRIDPSRVYVAGLSAGGAMALILAATYPDRYAAVGVHSAPAYRSALTGTGAFAAMAGRGVVPPPLVHAHGGQGMPPTVVFQGTEDTVVRPGNGPGIAEQWLAYRRAYAAPGSGDVTRGGDEIRRTSGGRSCAVTSWYAPGHRKVLEYWQIDGLGHAWSGGAAGGSFSDPRGPSASTAMVAFFSACRQPAGAG